MEGQLLRALHPHTHPSPTAKPHGSRNRAPLTTAPYSALRLRRVPPVEDSEHIRRVPHGVHQQHVAVGGPKRLDIESDRLTGHEGVVEGHRGFGEGPKADRFGGAEQLSEVLPPQHVKETVGRQDGGGGLDLQAAEEGEDVEKGALLSRDWSTSMRRGKRWAWSISRQLWAAPSLRKSRSHLPTLG